MKARLRSRPRVLLVGEILYHYRHDVFKALESDSRFEFEFVAGPATHDGSILADPPDSFNVVHRVRNRYIGGFLWQSGLLGVIRRRRPDAVIFLGDPHYISTWAGAVYARLRGLRVLYWTIGWSRPDHGLARHLRVAFYRLAHLLLLYGNVGRRLGIAAGYPDDRMTVIFNSSSLRTACPDEASPAPTLMESLPTPGAEVATAVLRLNRGKRLDMLITAAGRLNSQGRRLHVMLVGEGPEETHLRELAERLSVPLHLPGAVYEEATLSLIYARTTITVIPSMAGLTTLQSFRHGIPVISHDDDYQQVPEVEAIIEGITGSRYRAGDEDSLVQSIEWWLDRQAAAREETAAACRAVVRESWSAESQATRITSALVSLMDGRRSPTTRHDEHPDGRRSEPAACE